MYFAPSFCDPLLCAYTPTPLHPIIPDTSLYIVPRRAIICQSMARSTMSYDVSARCSIETFCFLSQCTWWRLLLFELECFKVQAVMKHNHSLAHSKWLLFTVNPRYFKTVYSIYLFGCTPSHLWTIKYYFFWRFYFSLFNDWSCLFFKTRSITPIYFRFLRYFVPSL